MTGPDRYAPRVSTPVVLTVGAVAVATFVAMTLLLVALIRRLKQLAVTVTQLQTRLAPTLSAIGREAVVAQQGLAGVAAQWRDDERQPLRKGRPLHSWRDG